MPDIDAKALWHKLITAVEEVELAHNILNSKQRALRELESKWNKLTKVEQDSF